MRSSIRALSLPGPSLGRLSVCSPSLSASALLAVRADSPFPYGVRHEDKMRIGDRLAGDAATLDEENIFAKQHRAAATNARRD